MNAEFTLLCYHQLICLADADESDTVMVWGVPVPREPMEELRDLGLKQGYQEFTPQYAPVSPADNRPADTDKTLYRWNHVSDQMWVNWGFTARRLWADDMRKRYDKAVVW